MTKAQLRVWCLLLHQCVCRIAKPWFSLAVEDLWRLDLIRRGTSSVTRIKVWVQLMVLLYSTDNLYVDSYYHDLEHSRPPRPRPSKLWRRVQKLSTGKQFAIFRLFPTKIRLKIWNFTFPPALSFTLRIQRWSVRRSTSSTSRLLIRSYHVDTNTTNALSSQFMLAQLP